MSRVTMSLTSGPETEPVLVGAPPEHGGSECLEGGSVVEHQVDVITWRSQDIMYRYQKQTCLSPSSEHKDILNIADTKNRNRM